MNPQDPTQPTPEPTPTTPPVEPVQPQTDPQPMLAATPQAYPQAAPAASENKTDTLGIISIILAFVGGQLIGLILGIIGNSKAKKEGYSNKLSKIGIILNVVFMILGLIIFAFVVLVGYQGAKDAADDVSGVNTMNSVAAELETYYSENQHYPESLSSLTPSGLAAESIDTFTASGDYQYDPSGCVSSECASYVLTYQGTDGENYTVTSLY